MTPPSSLIWSPSGYAPRNNNRDPKVGWNMTSNEEESLCLAWARQKPHQPFPRPSYEGHDCSLSWGTETSGEERAIAHARAQFWIVWGRKAVRRRTPLSVHCHHERFKLLVDDNRIIDGGAAAVLGVLPSGRKIVAAARDRLKTRPAARGWRKHSLSRTYANQARRCLPAPSFSSMSRRKTRRQLVQRFCSRTSDNGCRLCRVPQG